MREHYDFAKDTWPLAIHEAAHAVVGFIFGLQIKEIRVLPKDWHGGVIPEIPFSPLQWREDALTTLAGEEAQKIVDPEGRSLRDDREVHRAAVDHARASQLISDYLETSNNEESVQSDDVLENIWDEVLIDISQLLRTPEVWTSIKNVATDLVDNDWVLGGNQVEVILAGSLTDVVRLELKHKCRILSDSWTPK